MKKKNTENCSSNNIFWDGAGLHRQFPGFLKRGAAAAAPSITATVLFFIVFFIFVGALVYTGWIDASIFPGDLSQKSFLSFNKAAAMRKVYPLNCSAGNLTKTCPGNYPTKYDPAKNGNGSSSSPTSCPDYFRWIHQDLLPWKQSGITREMVDRAQRTAHFRLVILDGKAYVEKLRKSIQTRDMFTIWGILQLLRWYPGRLPDLELMFDCDDRPVVPMRQFRGPNAAPPPLFRYCGDDWSLDIVFPDWSFWGWAETNIKPWRNVSADIKEGNKRSKWKERVALAYWRGNPYVAPTRGDLLKCNVSDKDDWNTRLYVQDWDQQSKIGYKQSNLEDQCGYRYKIYIEGWAWSVSEKYILGCDSMTLLIRPHYHDFFIRGLMPLQHYWPIRDNNKCRDLKFAVEWGNKNTDKAQAMGERTSKFIQEDLKMDYVYDYMFHLLNEYAKLLKFKPTIPAAGAAVEVCSEIMACPAEGAWRKFMEESLEKSPTDTTPCVLPPPYDPSEFHDFIERKANATRQVELWENQYWDHIHNH